jgi:hypothetical protein
MWQSIKDWFWRVCGQSRTIALAYAAQILALLDEFKLIDWSNLLGVERGGRVLAICGVIMFIMRLVSNSAVTFKGP